MFCNSNQYVEMLCKHTSLHFNRRRNLPMNDELEVSLCYCFNGRNCWFVFVNHSLINWFEDVGKQNNLILCFRTEKCVWMSLRLLRGKNALLKLFLVSWRRICRYQREEMHSELWAEHLRCFTLYDCIYIYLYIFKVYI